MPQLNPYSKALRLKKISPLLCYVIEKILDTEKEVAPDEALLELKKEVEPCNCRELVIIISVVLSLHGNRVIPYINSHLLFFLNKN